VSIREVLRALRLTTGGSSSGSGGDTLHRYLKRLPATALFLATCVLVVSGGIVFRLAHQTPAPELLPVLAWQAAAALPWLLLAPLLLDAGEGRNRLARARPHHHLALALLVAGATTLWFFALSSRFSPLLGAPDTRYGVHRWFFLFWLVLNFAAYWAVLGVAAVGRRDVAPAAEGGGSVAGEPKPPPRRFLVESDGEARLVSPDEIDWIEAQDYYGVVHVADGRYWVKRSLDQFEKELDTGRFARIHRSTIVNVDRVLRIEMDETGPPWAILQGGVRRRFSQARWKSFRETFARKA
jgi:hypothetical protein